MIRCTATSKGERENRCVRQIGHEGLHRVIVEEKVGEFDDLNAKFPRTGFDKDELEAIIRGDIY